MAALYLAYFSFLFTHTTIQPHDYSQILVFWTCLLSTGFTYELCAGLIDKAKNLKQICKEEIEEEGG
jgi:hypothetical protein